MKIKKGGTQFQMFKGQKVIVVMPAYNAAKTLQKTYSEVMAQEIVDLVILVDDKSSDETVTIAESLPNMIVHAHQKNPGASSPRSAGPARGR